MIFSLEVRRARKGDCLLLHYGSKNKPGLILIDGGPKGVYEPHLRPRLDEIRKARVGGKKPLQVDLLMVSHVDDDHIQGILELTSELRIARDEQRPSLVQVLDLWHNSFDNVIDHKPEELTASVRKQFGEASTSGTGEFPDDQVSEVEDRYAESEPDSDECEVAELVSSSLKVLASIEQGAQLRQDARRLDIPVNEEFDGKLILADDEAEAIDIGSDLIFKVVGPTHKEVEKLRKKHNDWLKKLKEEGKKPSDVLAAYVDKSVTNLSSLVVLAEVKEEGKEETKKILLTGDARGDNILKGLKAAGLIEEGGSLKVDILKVPHHGSSNNLGDDFFERIVARHYVFSGDGEHGNPERESLEMLHRARGNADYTIHLTYPISEIDRGREDDWIKERNKQIKRKAKNPDQKVRPAWSADEQSLQSFFDKHPGLEAAKVRIVDKVEPRVINLLDELKL